MANYATGQELARALKASESSEKRTSMRFSSENAMKAWALEVNKIRSNRRHRTDPTYDVLRNTANPVVYAQNLFQGHLEALSQAHLQTSRMIFRNFEWLYPNPESTTDQIAIYDQLSLAALTVTDDQLGQIINMEPSVQSDPPSALGSHFYLRSWPLTADEMDVLLDYMAANEMRFEETDRWRESVELHRRNPSAVFTLRYAGTVDGPRRPIDRFDEDLVQRKSGVLAETLQAMADCLPDVAAAYKVHTLTDAFIDSASLLSKDDVERVLIEFFDHPTLFNRQKGGFYSSYVPSTDDADIFRDMKTNFWQGFRSEASLPGDHLVGAVAGHFQEVQQYANGNPSETGTGVNEFTDELRLVGQRQATPLQYHDETVMVFIGKDITYEEYKSPVAFVDGQSRAGKLTRDFLYRLANWEAQAGKRNWYPDSFDPSSGPYVFVDLWPWMWHKNVARAAEFLQWYLAHVRPVIANTYSRLVNNVTLANFVHGNGVRMNRFTDIVGKPTIQYYGTNEESGEPDPDTAYINIPHIHPGRDKYGSQVPQLRRVIDLTLQFTFLFGSVALEILQNDEEITRLELCQQIMAEVESLCSDSAPHKRFYDNLQAARLDLETFWKKEMRGISPLDEQVVLNAEGRVKLYSLGRAQGVSGSSERDRQLKRLWASNMPDLHVDIAHDESNKTRWMKLMNEIPEGRYYYLHLLAQNPPDSTTSEVLSRFRPAWATSDDWLTDDKARREAAVQAGLMLDQKREEDEELETVGARGPEVFLPPHPWAGYWIKALDRDEPQAAVLAKNLPMLRSSVRVNQQGHSKSLRKETLKPSKKSSSSGVQVHERYYILGAPGSALDDPFKIDSGQSCISEDKLKKAAKEAATKDGTATTQSKRKPAKASRDADDSGDEDSEQPTPAMPNPFADLPPSRVERRIAAGLESAGDGGVTGKASKAMRSKGKKETIIDEEEDDGEEAIKLAAPKRKRKRKSKAKVIVDVDDDDEEEIKVAAPKRKSNSKRKSVVSLEDDDDDDDLIEPTTTSKRKRPSEDAGEQIEDATGSPKERKKLKRGKHIKESDFN
ncbi:hypothetical protein LTR27_011996 [Elasticomyces elasticus]|nr:hypothetical protein LTR27_011996 [Elasticomyces elasticus]